MLEFTRANTLKEVSQLTQGDLDFLMNEEANSIGALLLHIASIEYVHQIITFENRDINKEEYNEWRAALELGDIGRKTINKHALDYYINTLTKVRKETLSVLKTKENDWLFAENKWPSGTAYNNYYLWYHVMEDEISHRGQIKIIKKMLQGKAKPNSHFGI